MLYGHGDSYSTLFADMHVHLQRHSEQAMGTANWGTSWVAQETVWMSLFEN